MLNKKKLFDNYNQDNIKIFRNHKKQIYPINNIINLSKRRNIQIFNNNPDLNKKLFMMENNYNNNEHKNLYHDDYSEIFSDDNTSTNINNIELGKFYYNNNENTPDYDYDINSN